jgi:hypothetical protein
MRLILAIRRYLARRRAVRYAMLRKGCDMKYTVGYNARTIKVEKEVDHDELHDMIDEMIVRLTPNYGSLFIERVE